MQHASARGPTCGEGTFLVEHHATAAIPLSLAQPSWQS